MRKHAKIVPITARKPKLQEAPKEVMCPLRDGSCVQLSFSELLLRYFQKTQEMAQAETNRPKRRKLIYLPTRRSDDSCNR